MVMSLTLSPGNPFTHSLMGCTVGWPGALLAHTDAYHPKHSFGQEPGLCA